MITVTLTIMIIDDNDQCDVLVNDTNGNAVVQASGLEELANHKVCMSAIGEILDIRRGQWDTLKCHVYNNSIPTHGNKGKIDTGKAKSFTQDVKPSLMEFFEELKIHHTQPCSTKVIRDRVN